VRIVLDTNVLISGLLNPNGNPGRVLDLFLANELTLLVDDRILAEYREVLRRPKFRFDPDDVAELLEFIDASSMRVAAPPLGMPQPDKQDQAFLEVGVAGRAECLVTGNTRDFRVPADAAIQVETPAEFIQRWRTRRRR
jgi:putative PIN family toxin of toxin-antitoxin system